MQDSQVTTRARLCDICLNLDFASIYQSKDILLLSDEERANIRDFATPFHQSFGSLRANAEFCDFCQLAQQFIDPDTTQGSGDGDGFDFQLYLTSYSYIHGLQVVAIDRTNPRVIDLVASVSLCVEEGNPLASVIVGRRISPSPRSSLVMDQIKGWMDQPSTMQRNRETKQSPNPVLLPTRVIEIVEDGQKVRLHITENTTGQYAALSHCWGSQQPLTLTCGSIAELKLGIPTIELPQTFQDAVWLTHQLGIQYVWIDSLCILQDDHDDWVKESAKMCDVYRNTTLMIAATRAAGSSEGFLGERVGRKYVSIPFRTKEVSGHALVFSPSKHAVGRLSGYFDMEDEPLSSRGWAFQEWCLARRILHFGTEQIWFEKAPRLRAEDSTIRTASLYSFWEDEGDFHRGEKDQKVRRRNWLGMVEKYSRRKLTLEEDKLPAIAGLAALHSPDSKGQYMAGLWADGMLEGLSWERDALGPEGKRPKKYRGPTWSWASIDGAITYCSTHWRKPEPGLATIRDAHVELESPHSPFGSVVHAWVRLEAILFPMSSSDKFPELFVCRDDDRDFFVKVTWDAESYRTPVEGKAASLAVGDETDLVAAPLMWTGTNDEPSILSVAFFIILKRADRDADASMESKVFTRVGAGEVMWSLGDDGGFCNVGIKELAMNKWEKAREMGHLQEITLL